MITTRVGTAGAILIRASPAGRALANISGSPSRFSSLLGLCPDDLAALNDDRVGRALEALFDADRASLLTAVVLRAVSEFDVDTSAPHNDSTSISVHGAYPDAVGATRGGKPTPVITFGHSKDHRPDLRQLVWILTVVADGSVPVAYRLADGNTSDDPTHVPTWDGLVALLGWADFLYVADSKLCSRAAMSHINSHGGRFVTVLPRSRAEDAAFREHLQTHTPTWTEAARAPGPRLGEPEQIYSTTPAPLPTAEGYRITSVHSSVKAGRDAATRQARTEAGIGAIKALQVKLTGPRCRFKTRVAVEQAATAALTRAQAGWVTFTVTENVIKTYKQERRGRPGPDTRYKEITTTRFQVHPDINLDQIAYDAASDGAFPLVTNDRGLTDAQVLATYRYQPNLERRHHLLKSVQDAAPVLLHNPARIEALFYCQFLALLIAALIEREVRTAMTRADLNNIALYPEFGNCTAPSTERILETFTPRTRHHLHRDGTPVQTFEPELTGQQLQLLELLGLPPAAYTQNP